MAASANTVEQVLRVVLSHVSWDQAKLIIDDLKKVEGNKSFKDTVLKLDKNLQAIMKDKKEGRRK